MAIFVPSADKDAAIPKYSKDALPSKVAPI